LWLSSANEETAGNMRSIIQGIAALAAMGERDNPELAKLARAAKIGGEGKEVAVSVSYPSADAVKCIKESMSQKKAAVGGQESQ